MRWVTYLGLIAGALTTISFLPQVIKTLKTRKAEDISLLMFTILCLGILLWMIYGFIIGDLPLITSNFIALIFTSIILVSKIKYG